MKRLISIICSIILIVTLIVPPLRDVQALTKQIENVEEENTQIVEEANKEINVKNIENEQGSYEEQEVLPLAEGDVEVTASDTTITLSKANSYKITNTSNSIRYINFIGNESSDKYYYTKKRKYPSSEVFQYWATADTGTITLSAGDEINVSLFEGTVKLQVPADISSTIKYVTGPAVYRVPVTSNSYFDIKCPNEYSFSLDIEEKLPECAYYVYSMETASNIQKMENTTVFGFAGETMRVSTYATNAPRTYLVPYEYRSLVKVGNTPAFREITLNKDDIIEINNEDKSFNYFYLTESDYKNGKVDGYMYDNIHGENTWLMFNNETFYKPNDKYSKSKFKITEGTVKLYYPYEKTGYIKRVTTPIFKDIDIKPNETLEIKHNGRFLTKFVEEPSSASLNYVNYDDAGKVVEFKMNSYIGRSNAIYDYKYITGTGTSVYTNAGSERLYLKVPYNLENNFNKINEKAIDEISLQKGNSIIINYDKETVYETNLTGGSNNLYDIVKYKSQTELTYAKRNESYSFNMAVGSKVHITNKSDYKLSIYTPARQSLNFTLTNIEAIPAIKIPVGKSIEFDNPNLIHSKIYVEDYYEMVTFDQNGGIKDFVLWDNVDVPTKIHHKIQLSGEDKEISVYVPNIHRSYYKMLDKPAISKLNTSNKKIKIGHPSNAIIDQNIIYFARTEQSRDYTVDTYDFKGSKISSNVYSNKVLEANNNEKTIVTQNDSTENIIVEYPSAIDYYFTYDGDLNNDKQINITDVSAVATLYNVKADNFSGFFSKYDGNYDLNNDKIIDLFDMVSIAKQI